MPSYYDSKKQKPSKAKVKYNAGGRTKTAGGFKKRRKPKTSKSRLGAMDRPLYKIVEIDGVPKVVEKAYGGQVKKMKGGGTVARGSGAARPQTFRKNG